MPTVAVLPDGKLVALARSSIFLLPHVATTRLRLTAMGGFLDGKRWMKAARCKCGVTGGPTCLELRSCSMGFFFFFFFFSRGAACCLSYNVPVEELRVERQKRSST